MQMMGPSLLCSLAVSLSCLVLQLQCAPPSPRNQTSPGNISHHSPTTSVALQHAESPQMVRRLVQTYILIGLGLCLAFAVFGCCLAFVCCPKLRRNVVKGRVVGDAPAATQQQLHQPRPTAPEIVVEPQAADSAPPRTTDQPAAAVAAASVESLAADSASSSSQATDQQGTPPPSYDVVQRHRASRYAEGGRGGPQGGAERPVLSLQAHNPPERPVSSKF